MLFLSFLASLSSLVFSRPMYTFVGPVTHYSCRLGLMVFFLLFIQSIPCGPHHWAFLPAGLPQMALNTSLSERTSSKMWSSGERHGELDMDMKCLGMYCWTPLVWHLSLHTMCQIPTHNACLLFVTLHHYFFSLLRKSIMFSLYVSTFSHRMGPSPTTFNYK